MARDLTAAGRRALSYRTTQLRMTFWRGHEAGHRCVPRAANPYRGDGRTFSTAYHNAWAAGWEIGRDECVTLRRKIAKAKVRP